MPRDSVRFQRLTESCDQAFQVSKACITGMCWPAALAKRK